MSCRIVMLAVAALAGGCRPHSASPPTPTATPAPAPPQEPPGRTLMEPYLNADRIAALMRALATPGKLKQCRRGVVHEGNSVQTWLKERDHAAVEWGFSNGRDMETVCLRVAVAEHHLRQDEKRKIGLEQARALVTRLENELVDEKDADVRYRKSLILADARRDRERYNTPMRSLVAAEDLELWIAARGRVAPFALLGAGLVDE